MNASAPRAMRPPRAALAALLPLLAGALSACSATRPRGPRPAPPPAAVAPQEPQAPAAAPPSPPPPELEPPATVNPPLPPCVWAEPAPKPRIKNHSKSKHPVEEIEPQSVGPVPPPMNAVVDAEVGRLDGPLTSILGKNVQSPKGEALGRVVDLLADAEGRVRVAIIDFGGFLGVGTRRIAVDWPLLHFNPADKDKPLILTVTRAKLQSAPEYKDAKRPRVLMPPAAAPDAAGADVKK